MVRDECLSIVLVLVLLRVATICGAFKYEIVFEEEPFKPCKDFSDNYLTKYITFPRNITILPDDTFYVNGDIDVIFDFQPKKYPFILEFYKKGRGVWQKTMYSFQRTDLCTSLFDITEIWHTYFKKVQEDQRVCPLYKGQLFSVDVVTEPNIDLPSNSMEGDYLARLEVGSRNKIDEGFVCLESYFSCYRI